MKATMQVRQRDKIDEMEELKQKEIEAAAAKITVPRAANMMFDMAFTLADLLLFGSWNVTCSKSGRI